jgi:hypothetical protein
MRMLRCIAHYELVALGVYHEIAPCNDFATTRRLRSQGESGRRSEGLLLGATAAAVAPSLQQQGTPIRVLLTSRAARKAPTVTSARTTDLHCRGHTPARAHNVAFLALKHFAPSRTHEDARKNLSPVYKAKIVDPFPAAMEAKWSIVPAAFTIHARLLLLLRVPLLAAATVHAFNGRRWRAGPGRPGPPAGPRRCNSGCRGIPRGPCRIPAGTFRLLQRRGSSGRARTQSRQHAVSSCRPLAIAWGTAEP